MRGICVNHHCPYFERPIPVPDDVQEASLTRCHICQQRLCHESGLLFTDAVGLPALSEALAVDGLRDMATVLTSDDPALD